MDYNFTAPDIQIHWSNVQLIIFGRKSIINKQMPVIKPFGCGGHYASRVDFTKQTITTQAKTSFMRKQRNKNTIS